VRLPDRAVASVAVRPSGSGILDDGRRVGLLATDEHVEPC
jgi:hypothetical protein